MCEALSDDQDTGKSRALGASKHKYTIIAAAEMSPVNASFRVSFELPSELSGRV